MRRALVGVGASLVCIAFTGALLLASHHGEQRRCAWLVAHHSPATATYDCTTTGAP
jgi:hypothetical protein